MIKKTKENNTPMPIKDKKMLIIGLSTILILTFSIGFTLLYNDKGETTLPTDTEVLTQAEAIDSIDKTQLTEEKLFELSKFEEEQEENEIIQEEIIDIPNLPEEIPIIQEELLETISINSDIYNLASTQSNVQLAKFDVTTLELLSQKKTNLLSKLFSFPVSAANIETTVVLYISPDGNSINAYDLFFEKTYEIVHSNDIRHFIFSEETKTFTFIHDMKISIATSTKQFEPVEIMEAPYGYGASTFKTSPNGRYISITKFVPQGCGAYIYDMQELQFLELEHACDGIENNVYFGSDNQTLYSSFTDWDGVLAKTINPRIVKYNFIEDTVSILIGDITEDNIEFEATLPSQTTEGKVYMTKKDGVQWEEENEQGGKSFINNTNFGIYQDGEFIKIEELKAVEEFSISPNEKYALIRNRDYGLVGGTYDPTIAQQKSELFLVDLETMDYELVEAFGGGHQKTVTGWLDEGTNVTVSTYGYNGSSWNNTIYNYNIETKELTYLYELVVGASPS